MKPIGKAIGIPIGVLIGTGGGVTPSVVQYREFTSMVEIVSPLVYDNGTRQFRKRISGDILYYEIEITDNGFEGDLGVDYLRFAQHGGTAARYRHGEDSNYFKLEFWTGSAWNVPSLFERQKSGTATLFRDGIDDNGDYVIEEWSGSAWENVYKFDVS